jgi:hypothetical protein
VGLQYEDKVDISGDPPPERPLTNKQLKGSQARDVNRNRAGPQVTNPARQSPTGKPDAQPKDKPDQQPKPAADAKSQADPSMSEGRLGQVKLTPEQQHYYEQVAQNPWMPPVEFAKMAPEVAWNIAHHIGAGWNALFDPVAQSAGQTQIWSRQDALGQLMQFQEMGGAMNLKGAYDGLEQHQADLKAGKNDPGGSMPATTEWFWQTFGSQVAQAPMLLNPLAWGSTLALSLAGQGPSKPQDIPGSLGNALPGAEIGTIAQHPEEIKDPAVAARLFWKSANAAMLGLSVLPMTRWLRGLKMIDPKIMEELVQSASKLKDLQPGDPLKLPDAEVLKRTLNLPLLPNRTLVVPASQVEKFTMVRKPGEQEYHDVTSQVRKRIYDDLGIASPADLPTMAPNWTAAQVKLFRATAKEWLGYDLERLTKEDIVPEDPSIFLEQVADQSPEMASHAMNFFTSLQHVLLQTERGPSVDPLNAAESMTHSIPATHGATEYVMNEYYTWARHLVEQGGLDERAMMKAMRDDAAYQALPPAAKMIVNAEKMIGRSYMRQAMDHGHRTEFVTNYDPRVKVMEEDAGGKGFNKKAMTAESKAHRQEAVAADPANPDKIVMTEKDEDVFAINSRMRAAREALIAKETMGGRQRLLEDAVLHGRDKPAEALRAITQLNEMEGKWPAPSEAALKAAQLKAQRLYPLFHENLLDASFLSRTKQIKALHSHIASKQAENALAHDGRPLALQSSAREVPADYRPLENASKAFDGMVFHPDFAGPLNRIAKDMDLPGYAQAWVKMNQLSVAALMFAPMIHGDNIAGRIMWLLGKHPQIGTPEAAQTISHSWVSQTSPWVALEKVLGVTHATPEAQYAWHMAREMEAIRAGVIPHFKSRGLANTLWSEYGKATGDQTGFERPGTKDVFRLPPAFHGIEGAARSVGHGYDWMQNMLWGRFVWPTAVFAFHTERAAAKAAHPELPDLVIDQMAAHMANRWQGAIEPMARSAAMNTVWKGLGFAINWQRSFYEQALPSYLAKSALSAHPELRGYILRQEMQSLVGLMAAQHISGNILNLILSGHPQWENDPHNRYALEITRPEILHGLQALGIHREINPQTGRDPSTGGKLVEENGFARQQLQNERMLGLEPGTTAMQGVQDMGAGHLAPIIDTLAAAFNLDLPQTLLSGTPRWIDGHKGPEFPWQSNLLATMAQFGGVSSTIGSQVQRDASGRPIAPSSNPPWLASAPIPDVVKRYAAPATAQMWNWTTGFRAPGVRADKAPGDPVPDQNYVRYDQLKTDYTTNMTNWSLDMMHGKMTPYEWRQKYSTKSHDYAVGLSTIFGPGGEYTQGSLGLYAGYQHLFHDAELPDGTGMDWAKLDGLQATFKSKLTASQKSDLDAEVGKHENAYPALGMYRSTMDNHTAFATKFANDNNISYGKLMAEVDGARGLDTTNFHKYEAEHPQLAQYYAAQTKWEMSTWPGRMYSLYYHTSALARWLIPMEGADTPAAEEQATQAIEQHYQAPKAPAT